MAEYTAGGKTVCFSIGTEQRSDGTVGPPYACIVRIRPCASGDILTLRFDHIDQARDIAVYRVVSLPPAGEVPEPQSGPGDG